jgi:hypothetical protein
LLEVDVAIANREMIVSQAIIVMDMHMGDVGAEYRKPLFHVDSFEKVPMADIEAVPE